MRTKLLENVLNVKVAARVLAAGALVAAATKGELRW